MRFTECNNCLEYVEARDFFKKDSEWCCICPKCSAEIKIRDIEDFLLPPGTKIEISDGRFGIIDSWTGTSPDNFNDIEYNIRLIDDDSFLTLSSKHFKLISDWRLTERTSSRVVKVCHYPKNQEYSNVPCYNCVDRAFCNRDILERLAAYEDSGLRPDEVKELKGKMIKKRKTIK